MDGDVNNLESKWDGRAQFFRLWLDFEQQINFYILSSHYDYAVTRMRIFVSMIPSPVREKIKMSGWSEKLHDDLEKYYLVKNISTPEHEKEARKIRFRIENSICEKKQDITDALQTAKLLLPLDTQGFDSDNPEELEREYERET